MSRERSRPSRTILDDGTMRPGPAEAGRDSRSRARRLHSCDGKPSVARHFERRARANVLSLDALRCRRGQSTQAPSRGKILERRVTRRDTPARVKSFETRALALWRHVANASPGLNAIDKLGVTGSSPVPPVS